METKKKILKLFGLILFIILSPILVPVLLLPIAFISILLEPKIAPSYSMSFYIGDLYELKEVNLEHNDNWGTYRYSYSQELYQNLMTALESESIDYEPTEEDKIFTIHIDSYIAGTDDIYHLIQTKESKYFLKIGNQYKNIYNDTILNELFKKEIVQIEHINNILKIKNTKLLDDVELLGHQDSIGYGNQYHFYCFRVLNSDGFELYLKKEMISEQSNWSVDKNNKIEITGWAYKKVPDQNAVYFNLNDIEKDAVYKGYYHYKNKKMCIMEQVKKEGENIETN